MSELSRSLVDAAAAVLPEAYDESCGVPQRLRGMTKPDEWRTEARAAVVAVLETLAADERKHKFGYPMHDLRELAAQVRIEYAGQLREGTP